MTWSLSVRLAVASVVLAACGATPPRTASTGSTGTSLTPPTTDEYGSAPGTAAAWATAERLVTVPTGSRDCGEEYPTSGFPTTAAPRSDHFACIVAAAQAGEPARYAVLGRDHHGGVAVTVYEVLGPAQGDVVSQDVDWTGAPGPVSDTPCTGLRAYSPWDDPTCLS
jgi:hypothetical protein